MIIWDSEFLVEKIPTHASAGPPMPFTPLMSAARVKRPVPHHADRREIEKRGGQIKETAGRP